MTANGHGAGIRQWSGLTLTIGVVRNTSLLVLIVSQTKKKKKKKNAKVEGKKGGKVK